MTIDVIYKNFQKAFDKVKLFNILYRFDSKNQRSIFQLSEEIQIRNHDFKLELNLFKGNLSRNFFLQKIF